MTATQDFYSLSNVAAQMGCSVRRVEEVAHEIGLRAAMRVDGRPYLTSEQIEQLTEVLKGSKK